MNAYTLLPHPDFTLPKEVRTSEVYVTRKILVRGYDLKLKARIGVKYYRTAQILHVGIMVGAYTEYRVYPIDQSTYDPVTWIEGLKDWAKTQVTLKELAL